MDMELDNDSDNDNDNNDNDTNNDTASNNNDDDDDEKDKHMNDAISSELLKLTYGDRNAIQEEIHGVRCLAIQETAELKAVALDAFRHELTLVANDSELKAAYNKILERQQQQHSRQLLQQQRQQPPPPSHSSTRRTRSRCFMETDDFRLRFLRCELFDVRKATIRFLNYLNLAHQLFGSVALTRQIGLQDFTKRELKWVKKGFIQLLPYRDRAGRRVMAIMGGGVRSNSEQEVDFLARAKLYFYIRDAATRDSVESQRIGAVLVLDSSVWEGGGSRAEQSPFFSPALYAVTQKTIASVPTRMVAIHYCFPNTPAFRTFNVLKLVTNFTQSYLLRVQAHVGSKMENRYKLKGYGIPVHLLPLTEAGSIKVKYFHDWRKLRVRLEKEENKNNHRINTTSTSSTNTSIGIDINVNINVNVNINQHQHNNQHQHHYNFSSEGNDGDGDDSRSRVVECPALNDVVFRQGTPSIKNPGNVIFRDKMVAFLEEFYGQPSQQRQPQQQQQPQQSERIEQFCNWLIADTELHRKGRFLEWSKPWNTWVEMEDRDRIKYKVGVSFRDRCKRYVTLRNQLLSESAAAAATANTNGTTSTSMEGVVVETELSFAFVEGGSSRATATHPRIPCCSGSTASSPGLRNDTTVSLSSSRRRINGTVPRSDSNFSEMGAF